MDKKFEIIEGDDEPDPLGRVLRLGGAVLGFTKKSVRFGFIMAAETGNAFMYVSGQRKYAQELEKREPKDRADRELRTARRAFEGKGYKPEELSTYAALDFAAANHQLGDIDPEKAIENTPAVVELVEKIPDTQDGARIAEQIVTHGMSAIVNDFNKSVLNFKPGLPAQRDPLD